MKALVFSDMHLHNWNYGSTIVDGMNSRLRDQANILEQIANYPDLGHLDEIVFGGDLFHCHGKIDAAVLKVAYEGIQKILEGSTIDMVINILVGNHDTAMKDKSIHSLHWLKAFGPRIKVIDSSYHDNYSYANVSYLSYTENKKEIAHFFAHANPVCFMHQGLANVPMGSGFVINEVFTEDMIPDHVRHVYTGHYHQHNKVSNKVTVIGSTMQLNWADSGDTRGFLIIDTEKGECKQIESVAPRFITLNLDGRRDCNYSFRGRLKNNFIRVINYTSSYTEDIRKGIMEAGARSVEFVPQVTESMRLKPLSRDGFHLPSLVADYEKQQGVTEECSKVGRELMK